MNDSSLLCARRADTRIPLPRYVASDRRTSASNYRRPNYDGFYTSVMEQKINFPQDGDPMADAAPGDKKGGVIFYSRLAGYPENKPSSDKARMYAGIVVPARPDEPLNCCQSGCVHCVWYEFVEVFWFRITNPAGIYTEKISSTIRQRETKRGRL